MAAPEADGLGANAVRATDWAWSALCMAAGRARSGQTPGEVEYLAFDAGRLFRVDAADKRALIVWQHPSGWARAGAAPQAVHALLDLYLPICNASTGRPLTVGHLGQSLDGYIATESGDSYYVTGPENLLHLHRMRSLCDAVVVGAGTVAADDPRLTTRRASGDHPVRVVLDPRRRLNSDHGVFRDDEAATLLVCDEREARAGERLGSAEVVGVPLREGHIDLAALLAELHARKLVAVFVEGGGRTVSAFLEAGLLDRLQVAIAPLVTGRGRPGIRLPGRDAMNDCLRPTHRAFAMGGDVLFDCDLRGAARTDGEPKTAGLSRIF